MNKMLASIEEASIKMFDGGRFLTFSLLVNYEGGGHQNIGTIALDNYCKKKERRVGTAYGCDMIVQLLTTLDVEQMPDAKGKIIYVWGEGEGLSFKPKGIESLWVDGKKKLIFEDVLKEHKELEK